MVAGRSPPLPDRKVSGEVVNARNWDEALAWLASNPLHPWAAKDVAGRERYRAAFERHLTSMRRAT